jgi:hypothetical protein
MDIGDIRPQNKSDQPQVQSPNDTSQAEQGLDQHKNEDGDEHHDQVQERNNDPVTRNFEQRKSRSGAKMMHLGPDKLTISKLDNIEFREIMGATRSNLKSRNQT